MEKEEELGERYLGKTGKIAWMIPFVPVGLYPDAMGVFLECQDLLDLEEEILQDFSSGLVKLFKGYHSMGIYSLNLSLFSGPRDDSTIWIHSRITPRCLPRPIGNSDITYLGMFHREPVSIMKPEEMASRLRPLFSC
ncbi:MAG: hypothetical protein JRH07_16605 [Deltaproteobacteria bacterium]|nr:hypothetical protein [Deltaproteobacteria bacterium]